MNRKFLLIGLEGRILTVRELPAEQLTPELLDDREAGEFFRSSHNGEFHLLVDGDGMPGYLVCIENRRLPNQKG